MKWNGSYLHSIRNLLTLHYNTSRLFLLYIKGLFRLDTLLWFGILYLLFFWFFKNSRNIYLYSNKMILDREKALVKSCYVNQYNLEIDQNIVKKYDDRRNIIDSSSLWTQISSINKSFPLQWLAFWRWTALNGQCYIRFPEIIWYYNVVLWSEVEV